MCSINAAFVVFPRPLAPSGTAFQHSLSTGVTVKPFPISKMASASISRGVGQCRSEGHHHTQWLLSHLTRSGVSLQITIPRGTDGFGFTICCDSPVRVQAVDSGKRLDPFHCS